MRNWLNWLATIRRADAATQQRGQMVVFLALGLSGLTLLGMVFLLLDPPDNATNLIVALVILVLYSSVVVLTRLGYVAIGAFALALVVVIEPFIVFIITPEQGVVELIFLNLGLLIASLVLRPSQIWLLLVLALGSLIAVAFLLPDRFLVSSLHADILVNTMVLMVATTFFAFLGARGIQNALRQSQQTQSELAAANTVLNEVLAAQRAMTEDLQQSLAQQQQLNALVDTLSLPLIPVRDEVLVAPLIGSFDSRRMEQVQQRILEQVAAQRIRVVILDITGMPLVDEHSAQALLDIHRALRLLGARSMLVGVRAEAAQALVNLNVDLATLEPWATLQQVLEHLDAVRSAEQGNGTKGKASDDLPLRIVLPGANRRPL